MLANRKFGSFVPGINDLVYGNEEQGIMGATEKMEKGRIAISQLDAYKKFKKAGDEEGAAAALSIFDQNRDYLGYGFLNTPEEAVPPVALSFNAFHIMVVLGTIFPLVFLAFLYFSYKGTLQKQKWLLGGGVIMFFLGLIAHQAGWVVAEVGRALGHSGSPAGDRGPLQPDRRHGSDNLFHVSGSVHHPADCRGFHYAQADQYRSGRELITSPARRPVQPDPV
jgi:hypothetical protein